MVKTTTKRKNFQVIKKMMIKDGERAKRYHRRPEIEGGEKVKIE